MTFRNIRNGIAIITLVAVGMVVVISPVLASVSGPSYVNDPASCPRSDAQFPGQSCPFGQIICGVNSIDVPQCYVPGDISAPGSSATSNTEYTSNLGGGFIIDCYTQPLDTAAPYCYDSSSPLCNRDDSCYTDEVRDTTCTAGSFGAFSCGGCRSGYQDCVGDTVCEVTTGSTDYPTGDNNNYGANCAVQCDNNYLDCDLGGEGTGNGCEINVGGSCGGDSSNAIYGAACDGSDTGDCGCSSGYLDCNSDLADASGQCEIQVNASCGTNAIYGAACDGANGDCACSANYFDCDASGAGSGNGCEVETATACTTAEGATGTYSGCTCVPDKSYFETGTNSVYATSGALLHGQNLGTGNLIEMTGAGGAVFKVFESGALQIGTYEGESGTGAGTIRWTGTDFQGYDGAEWQSFLGGAAAGGGASPTIQESDVTLTTTGAVLDFDGSDFDLTESPTNEVNITLSTAGLQLRLDSSYVDVSGDTMTGDLIIGNSATLSASGTIRTESGVMLNYKNEAKDSVLVFGNNVAAETLKFTSGEHRFEFSDDVYIEGTLTTTGLINGIDLAALSNSIDTPLKVSSGAGLTVSISTGSYRIDGAVTNYIGSGSVNISDQTTNYLFFTSTGLTIDVSGVPTDKSYIPLASVTTTGGVVTNVTDLRAMNSDDRQRTVQRVFHPQFANASLKGDGSNNVGKLYVDHDVTSQNNYYLWTSTITSLQDYDVVVRETLPVDFVSWTRNPISVIYKSTSTGATNNKMDISVFDTDGVEVTLSGATTGLAGTGWTTTSFDFTGSPTWTAEQDFLIKFKMYAKDTFQMHLGALKMKFVELLSEQLFRA